MLSLVGCGHLCVGVMPLPAQVCLLCSDCESKGLHRWDTNFFRQQGPVSLVLGRVSNNVLPMDRLLQKCSQERAGLVFRLAWSGSSKLFLGGLESNQANLPCFTGG